MGPLKTLKRRINRSLIVADYANSERRLRNVSSETTQVAALANSLFSDLQCRWAFSVQLSEKRKLSDCISGRGDSFFAATGECTV
jgi:hypothetical protein